MASQYVWLPSPTSPSMKIQDENSSSKVLYQRRRAGGLLASLDVNSGIEEKPAAPGGRKRVSPQQQNDASVKSNSTSCVPTPVVGLQDNIVDWSNGGYTLDVLRLAAAKLVQLASKEHSPSHAEDPALDNLDPNFVDLWLGGLLSPKAESTPHLKDFHRKPNGRSNGANFPSSTMADREGSSQGFLEKNSDSWKGDARSCKTGATPVHNLGEFSPSGSMSFSTLHHEMIISPGAFNAAQRFTDQKYVLGSRPVPPTPPCSPTEENVGLWSQYSPMDVLRGARERLARGLGQTSNATGSAI